EALPKKSAPGRAGAWRDRSPRRCSINCSPDQDEREQVPFPTRKRVGSVTDNPERPVINDRYQIEQRIGRGGMADVFMARDLLLDRPVAIKVLFPEFAVDPNFV